MSQRMDFDEANRGWDAGYTASREGRPQYDDNFSRLPGQKLGQQDMSSAGSIPSARQRLGLALCSLGFLLVACMITLLALTDGGHNITPGAIALAIPIIGLFSIAVIVVNIVFNRKL